MYEYERIIAEYEIKLAHVNNENENLKLKLQRINQEVNDNLMMH